MHYADILSRGAVEDLDMRNVWEGWVLMSELYSSLVFLGILFFRSAKLLRSIVAHRRGVTHQCVPQNGNSETAQA